MSDNVNLQNPAIEYFIEYWEDLCAGISSKRDLLKSFNPRVVIKELLDEITLNKQTNKANEEFFKRTLGGYLKTDPASQKRLKLYLQMMMKEIDLSKCRPRYLPKLCLSALKLFDEYTYIEDCVESLHELIDSKRFEELEKSNMRQLVNHLIVEFREIGYTDKEIRNIPNKIFSNVFSHVDSKYIHWDFPHQHTCADWENEEQVKQYRKALEEHQASLTEKDRISALIDFAKTPKEPIRYIFQVNGMAGTDEIGVAGVLFYSPLHKRLLTEDTTIDPENKMELFGKQSNVQPINASVVVEAISEASGEIIARSRIDKSFALCRRIMNGENSLWLSKSHIALDEGGKLKAQSSHAFERADDDITKVFSLTKEMQSGLKNRLFKIERTKEIAETNGWGRRFNEACYWLKRAEESDSNVDKLLSYWICIETICAKSDEETKNWFSTNDGQKETDIFLIKEVLGKIRASAKCYEHGWLIHRRLSSILNHPFAMLNKVRISKTLLDKAQLNENEGSTIYLKNLIDCSSELKDELPIGLLKDQVAELNDFYHDKKIALSMLKSYLRTTQDEIAFIYRMRNKIAHDGSSEHPLLPSLCKIAAEYALTLFYQIGNIALNKNELELNSVLIRSVQDYDLIEMRLQTEEPVNVFLSESVG